jgi:hypothetical protein
MVDNLDVRSISFRVGDKTYDAIREEAERDNRTLSNWIETVLIREIERLRRDRGEPAGPR